VSAPVTQIIVEGGLARGVEVKGQKIYAPLVISDAGASNTFGNLLPKELVPRNIISTLAKQGPSTSHFFAFIALKGGQSELQLPSQNYWIVNCEEDYDVTKAVNTYMNDFINGPLCFFYSFSSAKDPKYEELHPGRSTCIAFTETYWDPVQKWADSEDKRRPEEYNIYKEQIGKRLVEEVLRRHPHLRDRVDYVEYASPLTNKTYLNTPHGESLGLRYSMERITNPEFDDIIRPQTHIKNLYLTGQDAAIPGIFGAMLGGLLCAQTVLTLPDAIANAAFLKQAAQTYVSISRHFVQTKCPN